MNEEAIAQLRKSADRAESTAYMSVPGPVLAEWLRASADAIWTYPPFLEEWTGGGDGEYHAGRAAKTAVRIAHAVLGAEQRDDAVRLVAGCRVDVHIGSRHVEGVVKALGNVHGPLIVVVYGKDWP